jgi:hypothetical protein
MLIHYEWEKGGIKMVDAIKQTQTEVGKRVDGWRESWPTLVATGVIALMALIALGMWSFKMPLLGGSLLVSLLAMSLVLFYARNTVSVKKIDQTIPHYVAALGIYFIIGAVSLVLLGLNATNLDSLLAFTFAAKSLEDLTLTIGIVMLEVI